jgi:hypothetical protein
MICGNFKAGKKIMLRTSLNSPMRSPVQEKGVIFNAVTPEWQTFCEQHLHFAIPPDLQRSEPAKVVEAAQES